MVYAHKVNTREELLQWILSATRSINNAAVLRKVTSSLATRVLKGIHADGGHFEQLIWVFNGESLTLRLKTYFNNEQFSSFFSDLFTALYKLITPEMLRIGHMCIWRFWLRIRHYLLGHPIDIDIFVICNWIDTRWQ